MSRKDKPIIEVKGLSKEYQIGMDRTYKRFTESFTDAVRHPIRTLRGLTDSKDTFWALKDLNFEVERGEVLGIIGRNGAGKSTLLKILARITHPTEGEVVMRGRVGSLLEVGTGFHPELTGRENIFFNGAILGMKKREIDDKFDEIVKFSGVEKFLDTPVKRYSSGMNVRLAFSVAAHLEPEILLVDEVLAVGDAEFQKKCLGKMGEVASEGRTVLFVSHNMAAIEQLCSSCFLLEEGSVTYRGNDVHSVILNYLRDGDTNVKSEWVNQASDYNNNWFMPMQFGIIDDKSKKVTAPVNNNHDIFITISGDVKKLNPALQVGYALYNEGGALLYWTCHNDISEDRWPKISQGKVQFKAKFPKRLLNEGNYRLDLLIALYCREWICQPGVNSPSIYLEIKGGMSDSPYCTLKRPGILSPMFEWSINKNGE